METLTFTPPTAAAAGPLDALVEVLKAANATLPPATTELERLLFDAALVHAVFGMAPLDYAPDPVAVLQEERRNVLAQLEYARHKARDRANMERRSQQMDRLNRWHARQAQKRAEAAARERAEKERLLAEQKARELKAWEELNRQQQERYLADHAFQLAHADDPVTDFAD